MIEEYHHAVPSAGDETFLDEYAGKYRAEDAAGAVGGKDVERIVDAAARTPIDRHVADERDDKGDENALTNGDIAG